MLATNVAETSLTVPGIRYVVDTGVARISRYSVRTKVQRLPIEPISQASANQRSGRCGRVAAGIAIRLYSEEDFEARPEFTDPEILRTNLASVILQMTSLGLGDIARFPFVEPPDRRNVTAGVQLLEELGAVSAGSGSAADSTKVGRRLARLPIDPRLARMILEAERLGCVREVLVIAAALSLQDPRERPAEQQAAGRPAARPVQGRGQRLPDLAQPLALPPRAAARAVQQRVPADVQAGVPQLPAGARVAGLRVPAAPGLQGDEDPGRPARRHPRRRRHPPGAALGLLSHIGALEEREKEQARARASTSAPAATRFAIFPGSGLHRKNPQFLMAGELVETSRLWARQNAAIKPEWAERLGAHLVKRTYSEPHWSQEAGGGDGLRAGHAVRRTAGRRPAGQLRQGRPGAVAASCSSGTPWSTASGTPGTGSTQKNRRLLEEAEELEHRARRRDIVVDEHTLFDFYDARVGAEVVSGAHFDQWWKRERQQAPRPADLRPRDAHPRHRRGGRARPTTRRPGSPRLARG